MGWTIGVTAVLAGSLAMALPAQTRPDLSGEWTVEVDTPEPAAGARGRGRGRGPRVGDMGSGWSDTLTVTQDAARLTVEYVFFSRGDLQPPLRFVYALDGSTSTNTVMMGRGMQEQQARAAWDGSTLVLTETHAFRDPETGRDVPVQVVRRLTLEAPDRLVLEVAREGVLGGPATSTRTVYRKAA
jgi:hypothetical protein